jgi:hypothetical protein
MHIINTPDCPILNLFLYRILATRRPEGSNIIESDDGSLAFSIH